MADLASLLTQARALPDGPGVYIMKDAEGVEIYVGKAKSLRRRVSSYFQQRDDTPKTVALVEHIADFDYVETESEIEAFLFESRLIKDLQPKYNMMLKAGELYPYLEVTMGEEFPRVIITRTRDNPKSKYFGPYVSSTDLRASLSLLQRIFRFRACGKTLQSGKAARGQRACLNYHIGRCAGVCCATISKEEYRKRVNGLCRFLSGQKRELVEELRGEMEAAAAALQFEKAAWLRDLVESLAAINQQPALDEQLAPMAPNLDPEAGMAALREALALSEPPRHIEGIDIANLQGQETVGSLVYFLDCLPHKDGYRRFRIKDVPGQDDFASIAEVVRRRYGGVLKRGEPMPDLIMIDGGKGQLSAASAALREVGATPGVLVSLAKKEETLFREGDPEPVPIGKRNPGLKLLMAVRDEAHRFAQHYHHILRRKAMFNEGKRRRSPSKRRKP